MECLVVTVLPLAAELADLAVAAALTILATAALSRDTVLWFPDALGSGARPRAPPALPSGLTDSQDFLGICMVVYSSVTWSTLVWTLSELPTCA